VRVNPCFAALTVESQRHPFLNAHKYDYARTYGVRHDYDITPIHNSSLLHTARPRATWRHMYTGRRRRSHVSPESRQIQTNKQTGKHAIKPSSKGESTRRQHLPFEAKLWIDWIPNIFQTIDWPRRSVGLPLKKRHVEINAMFLHDQIRRCSSALLYLSVSFVQSLSGTSALHG
jgi:hypothetical protein